MSEVMTQYDIYFGGISTKQFSVRDVLSEYQVALVQAKDAGASEAFVKHLLRTPQRQELFAERIGSLGWKDICFYLIRFQVVHRNV